MQWDTQAKWTGYSGTHRINGLVKVGQKVNGLVIMGQKLNRMLIMEHRG